MLNEENAHWIKGKRGSLKIYLGYSAGVGKTFAMLQEANRLLKDGFDIVAGYIESHSRPETSAQIGSIEIIPRKTVVSEEHTLEEMDLDAILKRNPKIVIVDELAHSNVGGSRHTKRYEDVLELLENGINVISTLNIQHLESLADKIGYITGVEIKERVPDSIVGRADQIVNIDVTIEDLRERIRTGKIYPTVQADLALRKFFTVQNLSVLREIVLKELIGDQTRRIESEGLLSGVAAGLTVENVMVALSSDPSSAENLIRRGATLAAQCGSKCFVIYVQKKSEGPTVIDAVLQRKLQNNLKLAKTLEAEVLTLKGENIAELLVHFAHENNVRHAFFGKSRLSPLRERIRGSVLLDFIFDSVGIEIHIVPNLPFKNRNINL